MTLLIVQDVTLLVALVILIGATRGRLAVLLPNDKVVHVRLAWDQRSRLARARVGNSELSLPAP